ncbi:MAG: nucleoside-diphosphate kinase, partial [Planctomyces sp.]
MERTLILIKPDAVQRRLIGRVITRIEDKGLSIIGL